MATLAAAHLALGAGMPVHGLYTYGCPRVGDRTFTECFNAALGSRTFRFVNNNDIVTGVPTRSQGYEHVGTLRYFDAAGGLHEDAPLWKRLRNAIRGAQPGQLPAAIENHLPHRYILNLRKHL